MTSIISHSKKELKAKIDLAIQELQDSFLALHACSEELFLLRKKVNTLIQERETMIAKQEALAKVVKEREARVMTCIFEVKYERKED